MELKLTRMQEICANSQKLPTDCYETKTDNQQNIAIFVTRQENSFFTVISETAVGREKYVCNTQDTNLKLINPLSSAWLQLLLTS
jgi:hypothetical protein